MLLVYQSCNNSGETVNCQDSSLAIQSAITSEASCNQTDGTVNVEVTGGNAPYQYKIGGITTDDKNITGLGAGQHTLIVTDALGCEVSQSVQINTVDSNLNFDISIVQTDCSDRNGAISITAKGGSGGMNIHWTMVIFNRIIFLAICKQENMK
ncbi:MAG TPA: hypothetical protein DDY13_13800 [Cytophagales bacterium]|jgi:hypothetical protein|nr:hypothetical protein [Cytophagales bacterium]